MVGELSSGLEIVTDWPDPLHKGVICYLENHRLRGVLLRNIWDQVENARALMTEMGPFMQRT